MTGLILTVPGGSVLTGPGPIGPVAAALFQNTRLDAAVIVHAAYDANGVPGVPASSVTLVMPGEGRAGGVGVELWLPRGTSLAPVGVTITETAWLPVPVPGDFKELFYSSFSASCKDHENVWTGCTWTNDNPYAVAVIPRAILEYPESATEAYRIDAVEGSVSDAIVIPAHGSAFVKVPLSITEAARQWWESEVTPDGRSFPATSDRYVIPNLVYALNQPALGLTTPPTAVP